MTEINNKTKISMGLLVTIAAVIFSFGVLWNKVDNVEKAVVEVKTEIATLKNYFLKQVAWKP
jgi:hypothetical protein